MNKLFNGMLKVIVMDKGIVVIGTNQLIESLFLFLFIVTYFSGQFYLHGKQLGVKLAFEYY